MEGRAEQSKARQSRAGQSRAKQGRLGRFTVDWRLLVAAEIVPYMLLRTILNCQSPHSPNLLKPSDYTAILHLHKM